MCGIAGYISKIKQFDDLIRGMIDKISYRGPDSDGVWFDRESNVAFGHKRLAILDLSESGHQPMVSHSGRFTIVLNGEIYNYLELKEELLKYNINWRGSSDTEVLLELIEKEGLDIALDKCIGMFAFALYDSLDKKIYIARDRMGEKPLFYFYNGQSFVFSSELKPIMLYPEFKKELNYEALSEYLNLSYINHPNSIFESTYKVRPGYYLEFDIKSFSYNEKCYWDIKKYAKYNTGIETELSYEDSVNELEKLIEKSIEMQMRTDVPFGAFLSGGVDSSLVVSLMQKNSHKNINTFSIGFEDKKYDESVYAKKVANHIGTNHTELILNNNDLNHVIEFIPKMYDEPFADSSQIPTFLVSKLAREKVTVSLSGDAGDELFFGYNHYFLFNKIYKLTSGIKGLPIKYLSNLTKLIFRNSLSSFNKDLNIKNYEKIEKFINNKSKIEKYQTFFSLNTNSLLSNKVNNKPINIEGNDNYIDIISYFDFNHYLINDILVKVDRAAMYNSLETRVPLLDKNIIEFSLSLPLEYKFRNNKTKSILRDVLYRYVPVELIERKKQGFSIPIESWLKNELKEKVYFYLSEDYIQKQNIFDVIKINRIKQDFYNSNVNYNVIIWNILIFQMWYEEYIK